MKNKSLKILFIIILMMCSILSIESYAVTYTSTDVVVDSGGNVNIVISASEKIQNYDISLDNYSGLTYSSCSASDAAVNPATGSISYATLGEGVTTLGRYSFKAPEVTQDTVYNVSFTINGVGNTAKVTVKAPEPPPSGGNEDSTPDQTPNQNPTPDPEPTPTPDPEPEKPQEPNFTNTNKTMYANGDINLRDSWTTSSNATRIEKGTEVTVTATSTNTVNGYVWYKVSYNGQTKYVAGYLLTDKKPEEEKSDNANLKSLKVEGQELLPEFSSDVTSYSMNVKTDVEKLEVKAVAEDEKATVDIKGNKDLKLGDNVVTISVSAEDGTIKIYEIKVTRANEIPLGLKTLKIEGTDIHKTFKLDTFEYDIDIEEDLEKLEIEAIANDEKATVEILGNEELQEGENLITIIVKSEDGKETVTYQITVNKILKVEEKPVVDESNNSNNTQIYIYIGIIVVAGIALIALLVYFIKNRNTQKIYYAHSDYEDEEDFEGFPEELPEKKMFEDDNEEDDPNPFGRRGKHF